MCSGLEDGKRSDHFPPRHVGDSRNGYVNDTGHSGKNLIDFCWRYRFTTRANDLLRSPDDAVVTLLVALCQIASPKPAFIERCTRAHGVPEVTAEKERTPNNELIAGVKTNLASGASGTY